MADTGKTRLGTDARVHTERAGPVFLFEDGEEALFRELYIHDLGGWEQPAKLLGSPAVANEDVRRYLPGVFIDDEDDVLAGLRHHVSGVTSGRGRSRRGAAAGLSDLGREV